MTAACRRERSSDSLIRAPICRVESSAIAARSMEALPLAPGEDAEQEAEAYGDGHRRKRILPDCLFHLVCGLYRFILGAIDLLVGDARNRGGQALKIGANGVDLIGNFFGVAAHALLAAHIAIGRGHVFTFLGSFGSHEVRATLLRIWGSLANYSAVL